MDTHIPTPAENLIEAVELLHSLFKTDREVARRLKISAEDAQYIRTHKRCPERQLNWTWEDAE